MIRIFTDGAVSGNPGPGGWAMVVYDNGIKKGTKSGSSPNTTNNAMELTAILEAMKWASKHSIKVEIHTDSAYCLQGITQWMTGWEKKGWKTTTGPVKNLELWKQVKQIYNPTLITLCKVKGHSGCPFNDAADLLACVKRDEAVLNKI